MSEQNIQNKLSSAYNKVGKLLGIEYTLYRPTQLNDSLSMSNFLRKQYVAFTSSKDFISPQTEGFKTYTAYTNYVDLQVGDIFSDDKETFVIVWLRGIEDPVAIRATNIVSITETGWDTTNGLQQTRVLKAKNVPASVTRSNSTTDVRINQVANSAQANRYEVRIWSPTNEIKQTDNIILGDGTILHIDSMSTNELSQTFTCSEVKA